AHFRGGPDDDVHFQVIVLLKILFHFFESQGRLFAMQEEEAIVSLVAVAAQQFDLQDGAELGCRVVFFVPCCVAAFLVGRTGAAIACPVSLSTTTAAGTETEIPAQANQNEENGAHEARPTDLADEHGAGACRPMKSAAHQQADHRPGQEPANHCATQGRDDAEGPEQVVGHTGVPDRSRDHGSFSFISSFLRELATPLNQRWYSSSCAWVGRPVSLRGNRNS